MKKLLKTLLFVSILVMAITACNNDKKNKNKDNPTDPIEDVTIADGTENGHAYVDLGLPSGLLWAACNIGASTPEEYGNYYAWGETETKSDYSWATYKYANGAYNKLTKYCDVSSKGNDGFTDDKIVLDFTDDAARVNWGGKWRMPSWAEEKELWDNCTRSWTTRNDVWGVNVKGPHGNSIFLPAAGFRIGTELNRAGGGRYWSSSLDESDPYGAWYLSFFSDLYGVLGSNRYYGRSVRAVCAPR